MPILATRNLEYVYPDGTAALDGAEIEIEEGKRIAFVGQNGSGKSTLFLLLNGTLQPLRGEVLFHGIPFKYDSKSLKEIRRWVGIVFQNSDDQIFAPTVYQDVAFGPTNLGFSEDTVLERVKHTLEYVGLAHLKDKPPHHLSGGEKKRVAIAGVIAMEPEVIILDEPLSNLDPVGADEIADMLDELNHFGKTIIISTHDVDLAYGWSDYVYLLSDGKVIGRGTPDQVFGDPELLKVAGLRQPTTLEIYHEIERRGLANRNKAPRNVPELVDALKPPDLMWVRIPPDVEVGDTLNLGVMHGDYALHSPYEAVNVKVVHIHDPGCAIVEMERRGARAGCIRIYDMAGYTPEKLRKIMHDADIEVVGAMGRKSKNIAEGDGVHLDIVAGVIDKTILMTLSGKRCLILTNEGMVEHAMKRIRDYAEKSGIAINVDVADSENCGK
ncbi:MAG: ATP-binding cassette domain-containing protein [Euryarchaeota archaeon]|nr:ATP-binding cassette domain-containing protein [Euryarchaeota archaeon]